METSWLDRYGGLNTSTGPPKAPGVTRDGSSSATLALVKPKLKPVPGSYETTASANWAWVLMTTNKLANASADKRIFFMLIFLSIVAPFQGTTVTVERPAESERQ